MSHLLYHYYCHSGTCKSSVIGFLHYIILVNFNLPDIPHYQFVIPFGSIDSHWNDYVSFKRIFTDSFVLVLNRHTFFLTCCQDKAKRQCQAWKWHHLFQWMVVIGHSELIEVRCTKRWVLTHWSKNYLLVMKPEILSFNPSLCSRCLLLVSLPTVRKNYLVIRNVQ